MSTNVSVFCGNLCADCETPTKKVLTFRIAVNESIKEDEEWVDYPNYFEFQLFGENRIKALKKYLKKGQKVCVTSHAHQNRWEDKDGEKKSRVIFTVDDLTLCSSKSE